MTSSNAANAAAKSIDLRACIEGLITSIRESARRFEP